MSIIQEKEIQILIDNIRSRDKCIDCSGLSGSEKAFLVCNIYKELKTPVFVIAPTDKEGEKFLGDLRFFSEKYSWPLIFFQSYNLLPFKSLSYHNETAANRIRFLYQLINSDVPPIVVTTAGALLQKLIPKHEIIDFVELIMAQEEIDRDLLIEKLISGGYVRAAIVEEPGDFSLRGGIFDIFSPLYSDPFRIELFGDTVDSLRFFSAATQRKIKDLQEAIILPAREAILKKENMNRIIRNIREQASSLELSVTKVRDIIERIKSEDAFSGIESLLSLVYPELDIFFDYVPENALFILTEPRAIEETAKEFENQAQNNFAAACDEGQLCVEPRSMYLKWSEAKDIIFKTKPMTMQMISASKSGNKDTQNCVTYRFDVEDNSVISGDLKSPLDRENLLLPLANWIKNKRENGCTTILVCSTGLQSDRLTSLLKPYDIRLRLIDGFPDVKRGKGLVYVCIGRVSSGFIWPTESVAMITEDEIFGTKHRRRRKTGQKVRTELLSLEDLKKGDLVVHVEHGIGKYDDLVKLKLNGATNDFLLIIYRDEDKLYLPVDRMSMVQKYLGVDDIIPVLDKMGGKSWERVKAKAKKEVEKIAEELLKLYATRKVKSGHAFGKADSYFSDFEAGFQYEETTDQFNAINDAMSDMEDPTPMDRLVCGDVGYGKTEVALRASFKAVNEAKQVAILVPTTVLAEQHFRTFSDRFERYPVNIASLSRFRSTGEQREIINDLKTGKTDIVIGTHRLLQKDVGFKDLGLVVIDEEQRFGVKHKEKLKKIRTIVDVLTLTATPIPRTLHMSLMGIRDISIISTPPEERHAIITYISELDDAVISDAIKKELSRGGQIFFVHNNIHTIWKMASHLKTLVPEVRLRVAHGRLAEDELETVMFQFINKEIDMLVCTTIIESGLDIPSANTILINRADRFGLAQIYQLRGRVGRAEEQAYAYLFIPRESVLGRNAQKRLKVLMEHSDLGSGFQIAMSDLQIRGGGAALGASQSGHIAAVGYDMFLKLMENAITELKGEPVIEKLEPEINIPMSAFIPESYIPDIDQRLFAYRRFARMTDLTEISRLKEELIDRYGSLPDEAGNLLLKIMLKILSIKAGVKRCDLAGKKLQLHFSKEHQKYPSRIIDMISSNPDPYKFTPDHVLKVRLFASGPNELLAQAKNILKEIAQHVNG